MDKWALRMIAAAALVFALSVAVYVLKPRPQAAAYQLPMFGDTPGLFDPRTGTIYKSVAGPDANMRYWKPFRVMPPANQAQDKAPQAEIAR